MHAGYLTRAGGPHLLTCCSSCQETQVSAGVSGVSRSHEQKWCLGASSGLVGFLLVVVLFVRLFV